MKGLKKGFLSLMVLSALGWTFAPLSLGTALADNAAPAAKPAPAASAPKPAAGKKVAKKPAKKKMVKKHPVAHKGMPVFAGTITNLDMTASPNTIVVVKGTGRKHQFIFGGDISSKTAIFKGKKKASLSDLQTGQKVVLHYHRAHGTLWVTAIHIH